MFNNPDQHFSDVEDFKPNDHIKTVIASGADHGANDNKTLTTELDSHANIVLVGSNATVIQ